MIMSLMLPTSWVFSHDRAWQLNLARVTAVAEHCLIHRAACLLAQEMLCSTKAMDVSHEANGEALCPKVCELLQLATLKDFLFRLIKLLSAQMAVNAALNVALNVALNAAANAALLQIAKRAMGCCDHMF